MSSDATTGEDLQPDVELDTGETVGETLRADAPAATSSDVESSEASPSQRGELAAIEATLAAIEATPAADTIGEPRIEPVGDSAGPLDSSVGAISGAEQPPTAPRPAPQSAPPASEAYAPVSEGGLSAESRRRWDREPVPEAESEHALGEANDILTGPPDTSAVEMSVEAAAESPSSSGEPPIEPPLMAASEDEERRAEAGGASGEPRINALLDLGEQPADDALAELDLGEQPTEVALAGPELASFATRRGFNTPNAWSETSTLADPAYSPPDLPNATPIEPWMASAVSPDYEPPAAASDSARTPPIGAGMVADAIGRARRYPSAASALPEYPAVEYPTEYPRIKYPPPANRSSRLPLAGILAAAILAALIVVLLARNAILAAQPPVSTTLYSSAMTTSSSDWPSDKECYFSHDGYHIIDNSNCYYSGAQYQDATVTVTAKVLKGPSTAAYGIAFRRPSPNNFYIFLVTNNGDWFLVKDNAVLQKAVPSSAIKTGAGATNVLSVRMQGTRFTFYANGTQLGELTDDTYSTGAVGLSGDVNLNVVYRNFSVTRV